MGQTILRKTIGSLVASVAMLVGLSAGPAAYADDTVGTRLAINAPSSATPLGGNDNASVDGIGYCANLNVAADCWTWASTSAPTPCPSGHFCLYTNRFVAEGGKVFSFYHCRRNGADWVLRNWLTYGLYRNSNTGGARAYIKDINHSPMVDPLPGEGDVFWFYPAYYVQAC